MAVINMWVGAVTPTSAWVRAKIDGTDAELVVSTSSDLSNPTTFGPDTATANDIVSIRATGLDTDTRYFYALEIDGTRDTDTTGQFRTHPVAVGERASFTYAMATCAGGEAEYPGEGDVLASDRISNHPVFDVIRQADPLFFLHGGDFHYYDIGSGNHGISGDADAATFRRTYDDVLLQPRQHQLYRNVSLAYVWDDHDFGPNDSDRTSPGRDNACEVYRERVPHYDLPAGTGATPIYQSFQVGRALFLLSDVRADRDPNDDAQSPTKTMLGSAQKAWMERLLAENAGGAEVLIWCTPSQYVSNHLDSWDVFRHERREMRDLFGDTGWLNRMCVNSGDAHALSIDTGGSNTWGGFPVYQFSSLDSNGSGGPSTDTGPNLSGRGHYGLVRVEDHGHTIEVNGTGYDMEDRWRSHTFFSSVGTPVLGLDYSNGEISPPIEPTDDDQNTVNDVTAEREDGGEARSEITEGPLSVQSPPDGVGRYDESVTLNVASDTQLPGQAGWRTHLGTVNEARYPSVHLNLRNSRMADQAEDVLNVDSGDKITIANPPAWLPPEPIQMIAEGYEEEIKLYRWDVTFNASPASPWTVGEVADVVPEAEDFEDDGLAVTITDGGDAAWSRTQDEANTGEWSFGSGSISADQTSDAVVDVPDGATGVRFSYLVSSEEFARDVFARIESGTWGELTSRQTWTEPAGGDSTRDVDGDKGIATLASDSSDDWVFQYIDEDIADCEVLVGVSVSVTASGGTLSPSILLRHIDADNFYLARVHFTTSNNIFLSVDHHAEGQVGSNQNSGYDYQPGTVIMVRARIVDQTVSIRAWPESEVEPDDWQIERTVSTNTISSGHVGMLMHAFSGNDNTDPELNCHSFELDSDERPGDRFLFLIDGIEQFTDSGETGWVRTRQFPVGGADTVAFRYDTDGTGTQGDDRAYIDDLTFTTVEADEDDPVRADTAGAALAVDAAESDTELLAVTEQDGPIDNAVWVTTDGLAPTEDEDLPVDLRLGGETVRASAITPYAWDAFGRTETDTWGTSTSGHAYEEDGGSADERSVDGTAGLITIASGTSSQRSQIVDAADVGDCDISVTVSVDQTASGGSLVCAVVSRWISSTEFYLLRVHFTTAGNVYLSVYTTGESQVGSNQDSGYDYAPGDEFHVRVRLIGNRMLAKLWPATHELEPHHWQIDRTATEGTIDAGQVGLAAFAFSGNDNTDVTFAFAEFEAGNPQRMTVERSINTVETDHAAGTAISLDQPAVAGL